MTERGRQLTVLALLVVVFAVVLWWQLGGSDGGGGSGRLSPFARLAAGRAPEDGAANLEIVDLRLADLEQKRGEYSPGRDPFRFGPPPAAAKKPAPKPRRPAPTREVVAAPAAPPRQAKPRPPRLTLSYLGSFGTKGRMIAVFTEGDDIFNARSGDVLQEKFIVDKIGLESVDIKFVGFSDAPAERLAAGG